MKINGKDTRWLIIKLFRPANSNGIIMELKKYDNINPETDGLNNLISTLILNKPSELMLSGVKIFASDADFKEYFDGIFSDLGKLPEDIPNSTVMMNMFYPIRRNNTEYDVETFCIRDSGFGTLPIDLATFLIAYTENCLNGIRPEYRDVENKIDAGDYLNDYAYLLTVDVESSFDSEPSYWKYQVFTKKSGADYQFCKFVNEIFEKYKLNVDDYVDEWMGYNYEQMMQSKHFYKTVAKGTKQEKCIDIGIERVPFNTWADYKI